MEDLTGYECRRDWPENDENDYLKSMTLVFEEMLMHEMYELIKTQDNGKA
jgi:hypothetical protein